MYTDPSGEWALFDDIIAAIVGAVVNVLGQVVSDVITSIGTGNWQFSSWETYVGAAVGGAVGGWSSLYITPIGGGALGGFISTLTTNGLESITGKNNNLFWDNLKEATLSAVIGGLTANIKIFNGSSSFGNAAIQQYILGGTSKNFNYFIQTSLSKIIDNFTLGWFLGSGVQGTIG